MSNVTSINVARRVVNWEDTRWAWKRGVRGDKRLPDAAKVLAATLCDDFANHGSGFCNPAIRTLAESLGKSERSIQRCIAALKQAGWLDTVVRGRGDRGGHSRSKGNQGSEFVFLMGAEKAGIQAEEEHAKADQRAAVVSPFKPKGDTQRVTPVTVKGDSPVVPPCTPYKDKPNSNQRARGEPQRSATKVSRVVAEAAQTSSNQQTAALDAIGFWAEKISAGRYVAPSTIRPGQARTMLARGLVTEDALRQAGIRW